MLTHLSQGFPTPIPLLHNQNTTMKDLFCLRSHLGCDLPHAPDGCSGGGRGTGCRLDNSPVGWEALQHNYQPRESTALHRFTCTIHHLLTAVFSLCTLVQKCNHKMFLQTVLSCANIALNYFSRKESLLFYTNCLACLLHRIMIQKEADSSHAYS